MALLCDPCDGPKGWFVTPRGILRITHTRTSPSAIENAATDAAKLSCIAISGWWCVTRNFCVEVLVCLSIFISFVCVLCNLWIQNVNRALSSAAGPTACCPIYQVFSHNDQFTLFIINISCTLSDLRGASHQPFFSISWNVAVTARCSCQHALDHIHPAGHSFTLRKMTGNQSRAGRRPMLSRHGDSRWPATAHVSGCCTILSVHAMLTTWALWADQHTLLQTVATSYFPVLTFSSCDLSL